MKTGSNFSPETRADEAEMSASSWLLRRKEPEMRKIKILERIYPPLGRPSAASREGARGTPRTKASRNTSPTESPKL